MAQTIPKSTFTFLKDLSKNNDREWFNKNKVRYTDALTDMKEFMAELEDLLNKHDVIDSHKTYRIYKDVRFSKDKTPYKTNIGSSFTRAGASRRGGLYVNIEPGNTFVGGGFWGPNPADLKRVRKELEHNAEPFRKIINSKKFKDYFGSLTGDAVKTAPKGFDKNHPNIDLLRFKQYLIGRNFTDTEATAPNFIKECDKTFKAMRPFFDFMSETLTTDENGVSII